MKIFSRILSLLVIASLGLFYAGCGGGGGGTDPVEKIQLAKLSKVWSIDAANGASLKTTSTTDRTADFPNFKLTVSGTFKADTPKGPYTYTTSGPTTVPSPSPWTTTGGTWTFSSVDADGNGGNIVRDDGIPLTYKFTATGIKLTFNCAGCTYNSARTTEVNGDWTFNMH